MPSIISEGQKNSNDWLVCTTENTKESSFQNDQKQIYSGQLIACSTEIKTGFNFYYHL